MLLAIDIGNTNIHFGLWTGSAWRTTWRARTILSKMSDEYAVLLRSFLIEQDLGFADVDDVVIASVVPDLTDAFVKLSTRYINKTPLVIDGVSTKLPIQLCVDAPREVGTDRVVNAAAVAELYGGPAIVIDFGTATTYDIINAAGNYIGGVIMPGPGLAHDALVQHTAQLRKVALTPPPAAIGTNTIHAMQSGLFFGYLGMIEGLVKRIKAELGGGSIRVIATGGLAPLFTEHTTVIDDLAPNLTLDGMLIIWQGNQ